MYFINNDFFSDTKGTENASKEIKTWKEIHSKITYL